MSTPGYLVAPTFMPFVASMLGKHSNLTLFFYVVIIIDFVFFVLFFCALYIWKHDPIDNFFGITKEKLGSILFSDN
jgi:hypothetical protein